MSASVWLVSWGSLIYYNHWAQVDFNRFITQQRLLAWMAVAIGIRPGGSPALDLPSPSLVSAHLSKMLTSHMRTHTVISDCGFTPASSIPKVQLG